MNTTYLTKEDLIEFGKIPDIKTEVGLKRLFNKRDEHNNSKDYDLFFYKGFLYQPESIGWDYGTTYISLDANSKIETDIYFNNNNNNRLFKNFEEFEIMSWRNDLTFYTLNKEYTPPK